MNRKQLIAMALSAILILGIVAGFALNKPTTPTPPPVIDPDISTPKPDPEVDPLNFVVLTGPSGVGAAKLMSDNDAGTTEIPYDISVVATNEEVVAQLTSGETDIAAIATNVASNLYNKTDGDIQMLTVSTLGVLYILEKGDSVESITDLRGKTIWTVGQGANPEFILNYLLEQNGLTPDEDVTIQFMTAQEVSAKMLSSEEGVCMLPVPASTALMIKDNTINEVVGISDEWDAINGVPLPMSCIVARTEFVKENPEAIDAFMADYEASINYMNDEETRAEAAQLVADYGITPNAKIAELAIPKCNLTFITENSMRLSIQQYFEILFASDPKSIGGSIPYDDFYYFK